MHVQFWQPHPLLCVRVLVLSPGSLRALLVLIDAVAVCARHPAENMVDLADEKKGVVAFSYLDDYAPVMYKGTTYENSQVIFM